jgi:hypothetical protein
MDMQRLLPAWGTPLLDPDIDFDDDIQELIESINLHQGISCHLGYGPTVKAQFRHKAPPVFRRRMEEHPHKPDPQQLVPPDAVPKEFIQEEIELAQALAARAARPAPRPINRGHIYALDEGDQITNDGIVMTVRLVHRDSEADAGDTKQLLKFRHPVSKAFVGLVIKNAIGLWEERLGLDRSSP